MVTASERLLPKAAFWRENRFSSFAVRVMASVSVIFNSVIRSFFSGGRSDIDLILRAAMS